MSKIARERWITRIGRGITLHGRPESAAQRRPRLGDRGLALILVLPTVLWVLLLILYPLFYNAVLSFGRGPDLYRAVLSDASFWQQVVRTLVWTGGSLLVIVPLGLAIAVLMNQDLPWLRRIRPWILLPWMFEVIVVVLIWRWLLEPNVGIVNSLLRQVGIIEQPVSFFGPDLAMLTVILTNAWRWIPFVAVVLFAALQDVPQELYEAAAIDGAGPAQRFRYVTLPHVLPALAVNTFILLMWLFNMFPPIWLMTRGGPNEVTTTLPIALYQTAFELFQFERGAVLAMVLFVFVAAFAAIYWVTFGQRHLRGGTR